MVSRVGHLRRGGGAVRPSLVGHRDRRFFRTAPEGIPVVVPYIEGMLRPEVVERVDRDWPRVLYAQLDPDDVGGYARLVIELWELGRGFVMVEHDVIPPPGAVFEMIRCSALWCCHPYPLSNVLISPNLGCARVSAKLTTAYPTLARDKLSGPHWWEGFAHWRTMDTLLATAINRRGVQVHTHFPPAWHLH